MDIRKYFGSGNVQKPAPRSAVPAEKKAKAKDETVETLPKKVGSQKTKSSGKNQKEENKPTLIKQMSTASQHISDIDEDDFPEVDQKKIKNKTSKHMEKEIKSTKVCQGSDKTTFSIRNETSDSDKNDINDKNRSGKLKTFKIPKKVEGSLKRRRESDSSEDEDILASKKKKNVVVSDSDEDTLPKTCTPKKKSQSLYFDEAFTRVVPKSKDPTPQVPEVEQKKKVVNSREFFGCSPVQRKESRHLAEKTATNSMDFQEESNAGSLTLTKKLSGKRKREKEEDENCMDDRDLTEMSSKRSVKEASSSVRGSNGEKSNDYQSPDRKIKPDVDSPARSAKKDEDRRKSYLAFVNREPPKALGSKEIPQGEENCLEGLTFVMTGVLESIERDDCKSLIERYGGKVTTNISRNTKYLVVGRDAGVSKISKANELKTKQINEDELFELLRTLPGKKSKYELKYEAEKEGNKKPSKRPLAAATSLPSANKLKSNEKTSKELNSETTKAADVKTSSSSSPTKNETKESIGRKAETDESALLWVDKYKPTSVKSIIGQQGDKSQAKKLYNWLMNWHKNINKKPIYGRQSEDGCGFKAALLSGPPGIGKTTTAHLVCQEAGFSFFELNASDTRSKKSLKECVSEALNCHSLQSYFSGKSHGKKATILDGKKHCLVMDEVDGMAGNEDRGGVQEMIQLIKTSQVPIVCMCNDRNHPKIRSLANYCFDLRFQRPRVEQIKGLVMSIAFKEGLKIPPPALNEIIIAANQDIRQVIHNLSMWTVKDKSLTYDQLKQDALRAQKDLHLVCFDVCRKVFSGEDGRKMTLNDKSDLFFHDYNLAPLFVHENYLAVKPYGVQCDSLKHLKLLGEAANSISMGDLVDSHIRRNQSWGLLPTQAMLASVIPGECLRGAMGGMIAFPSWLGKNSTTNKNNGILQRLKFHTSLSTSCNKQSLNLDLLPAMKHFITKPLVDEGPEGVDAVVSIMNNYNLLRQDFDDVLELSSWSDSKDVMSLVDSKVKAAFTRAYNKESHALPYSNIVIKKSSKGASVGGLDDLDGDDDSLEVDEEQEEDDITTDAMIMAKKPKPQSKNAKTSDKAPTKKGKQEQKKARK